MLPYPFRTTSDLRSFVRTMVILPNSCSTKAEPLTKLHPNVDISKHIVSADGRVLKFEVPTGDTKRSLDIVMDLSTLSAAVIFGRVGIFSNHSASTIEICKDTNVFCGETAFVLRRLAFMYQNASTHSNEQTAHFCEIWDAIAKANTPHGAQTASYALRKDLFKSAEWDLDSRNQMYSMLLLRYVSDEDAFEYFNQVLELLGTHHIANVCFVEVGDNKTWSSGATGEATVAAVLALDQITPEKVAGAVRELGGQNKLGESYDLLYDTLLASNKRTFDDFRKYVVEELPPLFELESGEPPAKRICKRSGSD